ncbi:hypothetical protein AB0M23_28505 [Streptomyces sp. NPDC052077]|uniref:hypothetical protein n=1 Tax=Streptomyces sp. NPDC052077 TaxID=3154757 RepID=UPI0034433709
MNPHPRTHINALAQPLADEATRHQGTTAHVDELLAVIERVRALATRFEEFAENALKTDDRELYRAIAGDIRTQLDGVPPGFGPVVPCIARCPFERSARAADVAAETARAVLAELYGPTLGHLQHRFTAAPHDPDAEQAAEQRAREMADQHEKTARVFAGPHQSAEDTVSRVTALHEQWVAAGPPLLGAPLARWWDIRLTELHNAIQPPAKTTEK